MARRKRASMREGPLADLFRSTIDEPADPPEAPRPGEGREGESAEPGGEQAGTPGREAEDVADVRSEVPEPQPEPTPDPDPVPEPEPAPEPEPVAPAAEPRIERTSPRPDPPPRADLPAPTERLSRIFGEDPNVLDGPRYGRQQPAVGREARPHTPVIRVVGVGGAGVNAINRMVEAQIPGVEFMAVNTDLQSLQACIADVTVHIGETETRGLGTGADPELGFKAAFDEQDKIKRLLKGSDMVFIAAGSGGGTGPGAAPVVARLGREVGALTVGIVTRPFSFEGSRRATQAKKGVDSLAKEVDTLIVVPNDRLLEVLDQQTSMVEAFQVAEIGRAHV